MTSFVTTSCPQCGEIDIALDEVTLRVNDDDGTGACVICCPQCGARFAKAADDAMMILLVAAGIAVDSWTWPAEMQERETGLPPITHAELVAFAEVLDDPSAITEWLSPEAGRGSFPPAL